MSRAAVEDRRCRGRRFSAEQRRGDGRRARNGKGVGFADYHPDTGTIARYYDNFYVATPPAGPIVCHASQSIEFSSAGVLREDASGTYWGPPPEYVGGRFFIPPAGDKNRKTRIAVMARRNDVTTTADDHIFDSTTVQVFVTPRYLVIPRG